MNYRRLAAAITFLFIAIFLIPPALAQDETDSIERISPESAKEKLDSGEALVVCSYNDQKCGEMMINGAITSSALDRMQASLPKDQELIFYCG